MTQVSAFASDPVVPKDCNLDLKPRLLERKNPRVVETIEGALDYRGRAFWWDALLLSSTTTSAGAAVVGNSDQEGKEIALGLVLIATSGLSSSEGGGGGPGVTPFRSDGRTLIPVNAQANDPSWFEQATRELKAQCQDRIREEFPEDVIEDDGQELVTARYKCSDVYPKQEGASVRLMINLIKHDAVFEELSLSQTLQLKCKKLQVCLARAKPQELEWVYRAQADLGCGN